MSAANQIPGNASIRAREKIMLILLIILIVLMFGSSPIMPYSRGWGYYPSGGLGLIVLILLIVLLMNGGLHF
jgi:low affinity Fe/Cu permease